VLNSKKSELYVPQNDKFDGYLQYPRPPIMQNKQNVYQIKSQSVLKVYNPEIMDKLDGSPQMKQIEFLTGSQAEI